MSELGPEARSVVDAGRAGDDPTPRDRARVRAALMTAIAAGSAGTAAVVGEGAAAAGAAKGAAAVGAAGALASGVGVEGALPRRGPDGRGGHGLRGDDRGSG